MTVYPSLRPKHLFINASCSTTVTQTEKQVSPKASPSEDVPKKKKGKKAKAEEEEEEEEETETGEKFTVVVKQLPWKVNSLLVLSFEHLDRCLGSFLSLLFSSAYLFLLCNSTCDVIVVRLQYALVLCLSLFLRDA